MARILFIFFCFPVFSSHAQKNIEQFAGKIDSLVLNAIDSMAFPGAQVYISYEDTVLLHKAYGFHTYNRLKKVDTTHLYDLASVTKIMAGGLSLMKLQELDRFYPSETLSETHPFFKRGEKGNITWQEILAHQSGLEPYIVFWKTGIRKNGKYRWRSFSDEPSNKHSIRIDDNIYLHKRYPKKMRRLIRKSKLNESKQYLYSGLAFLLIPELVENRTGKTLDVFLKDEIFKPLEANRITYNPLSQFSLSEIVPTERDTFFRMKQVHGYVHDENAAMLNGVSANAGLFSNAASLALIARELLYADQHIIDSSIIEQYTSVQFPKNNNRRGLAFDKPPLEGTSYIAPSASPSSFGHSGFTGTFVWIDPEHELVVIFLSNRVHPYRSNRKLYSLDFRPKLHQAAYDFILPE